MSTAPLCRSCMRLLRQCASISLQAQSGSPPTAKSMLWKGLRYHQTRSAPSPFPSSLVLSRHYATTSPSNPTSHPAPAMPGQEPSAADVAQSLQGQDADFTETYVAFGGTEALFKECARQADYTVAEAFQRKAEIPKNEAGEHIGQGTGWWYETLGLTPTFNTWAQVTMLHMYIIAVRIRCFPPSYSSIWMQHLTDHFFYEAEHRMTIFHQLSSRMMRNKYLKELYDQWRGVTGAYDEGLIRGDAVLGAAIWRNVFKARDDVNWEHVAMVVSFMRRGLRGLDRADDKRITSGMIKFGSPSSEQAVVEQPSEEMSAPFDKEDDESLKKVAQDLHESKAKF